MLSCENLQPEFFGKRKSCVRGRSTHTILISYPSPTRIFSSTPTISAFTQQLKACLSFQQLSFQTIAGLLKYSFVHIIPFAQKRTLNLYHPQLSKALFGQTYLSDFIPYQANQITPVLQTSSFFHFCTPTLLPGPDGCAFPLYVPLFIYLSKSVQKSISLLTLSSIVSVEQFPSSYSKDFICTSQTTLSFGLRLCLISPARVEESLRARFESNFPLSCMYQMMGKLIDFLWGNITWYIFTRQ